MAVTRNVAVPSVDFKCAMTIYAKSRSIIAVVFNNSFIPLATRRTEKDDSSGRLGNSDGKYARSDGGEDSGKRQASSNYNSSLVQVSNWRPYKVTS